jgi:type II secretory pathway predicted ATPase ExeA
MMYESFYGFSTRPFLSVPLTCRYFPGTAIEVGRQNLTRCIERAEGCGLVIGPTGTGKTLLCEVLAEHFRGQLNTVLLTNLRLTNCKEMLQAILYQLGVPYRRLQEGELRLSLIDYLTPGDNCPHGMLLLVDEAHMLSPRLFEELRLLTNLVREGSPRVRLIMAGGSVLEERFAHPRMASFNQRLAVRCYLETLCARESKEYVRAQTAAAGADPDSLWTDSALGVIYRNTAGCPRLLNQLCDHALLLAAAAGKKRLEETEIEIAWADLQQLPLPTSEQPADASDNEQNRQDTNVIEFASLEGDVLSTNELQTANSDLPGETYIQEQREEILDPSYGRPQATEPPASKEFPEVGSPLSAMGQEDSGAIPEPLPTDLQPHQVEPPSGPVDTTAAEITISEFKGVDADNVIQLAQHTNRMVEQPTHENTTQATNKPTDTPDNSPVEATWKIDCRAVETSTVTSSGSEEKQNLEPPDESIANLPIQTVAEVPSLCWQASEHPTIPVRQRDYRELFARLYDNQLSQDFEVPRASGHAQ